MGDQRLLILEDGTLLRGFAFGFSGEVFGEVVFNTGMTGYQESLTDPSYCGQILTLTYPLIGNYGINTDDFESKKIQVRGLVVSAICEQPSNFRSKKTINEFLKEHKIPGIYGVDTRALTKKIREHGTLRGRICKPRMNVKKIVAELKRTPYPDETDLIPEVTRKKTEIYNPKGKKRVALIDTGAKQNIIRCLVKRGVEVHAVPASTTAEDILKLKPDGIMLSNGPGNPEKPTYVIETIQKLLGKKPIFGICLGNQLLAAAAGAKMYKLKFGHRGLNHPVKDLRTGRVYITSQNHGYAIDPKSLQGSGFKITHTSLNDNSIEGIKNAKLKAFAVQYHPEASPGPQDNEYLFDEFVKMLGGKHA